MALNSDAQIKEIQGRKGYANDVTDGLEDTSGGVEHVVGNVPSFTVWLKTGGAVNVDIELSPDGGTTWYMLPESPVKFSGADDNAVHISYNCNRIRLTGSDATGVQAQVREVL